MMKIKCCEYGPGAQYQMGGNIRVGQEDFSNLSFPIKQSMHAATSRVENLAQVLY